MSKKLLLSFSLLLSACGQKGPLYLPQDAAAPAQPVATTVAQPATTAPAERDSEQSEKDEEKKPAAADENAAGETGAGPAVEK